MRTASNSRIATKQSHRPRAVTVFAAAFVAGAALAVGVNRALDIRLAQAKPRVESEAIFVALRSLPQGSPVTVWDVALRDWPKAMLPATALRANDDFDGSLLKHPLREGQPLLSIQLVPPSEGRHAAVSMPAASPPAVSAPSAWAAPQQADADLWAPAEAAATPPLAAAPPPASPAPEASPPAPAIAQVEGTQVQPTVTDRTPEMNAAAPQATAPTEPHVAAMGDAMRRDDVSAAGDATAVPDASAAVEQPAADETAGTEPTAAAGEAVEPPRDTPTLATDPPPAETLVSEPTSDPVSVIARAAEPPEPPFPADRPRGTMKYLVVPESIAAQADASFATGAPSGPQSATPQAVEMPPGGADAWKPSPDSSVMPLPATAQAAAGSSRQPAGRNGQPRPPQRQGRQPQAKAPATGTKPPPQPRFGSAMFPNLSAGVEAIESEMGRVRRQRAGGADEPAAQRPRPLTAR